MFQNHRLVFWICCVANNIIHSLLLKHTWLKLYREQHQDVIFVHSNKHPLLEPSLQVDACKPLVKTCLNFAERKIFHQAIIINKTKYLFLYLEILLYLTYQVYCELLNFDTSSSSKIIDHKYARVLNSVYSWGSCCMSLI